MATEGPDGRRRGDRDDGSASPRAVAARALALVNDDPSGASALANQVLASMAATTDPYAVSMAERVLGLAARHSHDLRRSAAHLDRAVTVAEHAGLRTCAAEARLSLVGTLALAGDPTAALAQADRAADVLRGIMSARLETQRAHVYLQQGRIADALDGFGRALPVLRRGRDRVGEARLYELRAIAHYARGSVGRAESDLHRAEALFQALGEKRSAANARVHLGLVVALRGDIPEALSWFDRAEELSRGSATANAMALIDRSEVLLGARLVAEAKSTAEIAVETLAEEGEHAYLAIARLRLAEAAMAAGDLPMARTMAEEARGAFARQRRRSWAVLARYLAIRAAWLDGERSTELLAGARAAARELDAAGFATAAIDARLLAAPLALELGRRTVARRELELARRPSHRAPVQLRVRAWHAEALLRLADGNRRGADSALVAGVRLLDRYRAALGATELRALASGHAAELTQLGLGLAIADGRPERVLDWAERWRAGCLRLRPVRPPDDERLAATLSELRAVVSEVDAAALLGKPTAPLRVRQVALEEAVQHRARHATGVFAASLAPPPTASTLARSTGEHTLVEMVDDGGVLYAAVVAGGRVQLHRLAPALEVGTELHALRFALRRLALNWGSPASLAAAADAVAFGAKRLDDLLLAPLASGLGDRPLVVIPTGQLHALPWSVLPSCAGRSVTVAPSAALWLRATTAAAAPGPGSIVLVAGPGLMHARSEVAALARGYKGAHRLSGTRASCERVSAALDGARLAHIAAHGRFRADNPLFSSLQLADGPITVYDLERLDRAPSTLVLSACDSGLSQIQPGDELMGLAAALFALGNRTLIASVLPVPDAGTRRLMLALHRGLRQGLAPALALARAQVRVVATGHTGLAAAAGFVCFGSGSLPVVPSPA